MFFFTGTQLHHSQVKSEYHIITTGETVHQRHRNQHNSAMSSDSSQKTGDCANDAFQDFQPTKIKSIKHQKSNLLRRGTFFRLGSLSGGGRSLLLLLFLCLEAGGRSEQRQELGVFKLAVGLDGFRVEQVAGDAHGAVLHEEDGEAEMGDQLTVFLVENVVRLEETVLDALHHTHACLALVVERTQRKRHGAKPLVNLKAANTHTENKTLGQYFYTDKECSILSFFSQEECFKFL